MASGSDLNLALAALCLEAAFGYPPLLYRVARHPVTWIGATLGLADRIGNRESRSFAARRAAGVLALALVLALWAGAGAALAHLLEPRLGFAALAVAAAFLPAQRSLHDHVAEVAAALEAGGLDAARTAVGAIVGRYVAVLDEAGVARAAIESLAENFSDGVVAPAVWLALLGLPGGLAYKAINTADSMIGHRTPRYAAFGWASARLDDLVNMPASRLSAAWLIGAAALLRVDAPGALRAVRRDARAHRSPNAGWPEAAMAGALGLRLAGPRVYAGEVAADAFMGDGRREAKAEDIRRALRLYRAACAIQILALAVCVLILRV